MKQLRMFIPGKFEDAYLYMGWLALLTSERTIRAVRVDELVDSLAGAHPKLAHLINVMFAQNQWIGDAQYRSWLANTEAKQSFFDSFTAAPQPHFDVNLAAFNLSESDLSLGARVCLDILIYSKRLFVCADSGFYGANLEIGRDHLELGERLTRRLDARCISTTARYGAVSVSCGDEGLWGSVTEFDAMRGAANGGMKEIETKSVKARWLDYDLVNYPTVAEPQLITNQHRRAGAAEEGERSRITEFGTGGFDLSFLMERIQQGDNVRKEDVQYAFNSNRVLFVHTRDGHFYSLGLRRGEDGRPAVEFTRTYKGANVRILSATPTRVGVVVETDERVLLFSDGEWLPLLESAVISVRTFQSSRRYQNLVAITADEGVYLVAVLNDQQE